MGSTQDTSWVILGVIAAGLIGTLSTAPVREKLVTVLVAVAFNTLHSKSSSLPVSAVEWIASASMAELPVTRGTILSTLWKSAHYY